MPAATGGSSATGVGSQPRRLTSFNDEDDDDFQNPCTLSSQSQLLKSIDQVSLRKPLRPANGCQSAPRKRPRPYPIAHGKENTGSGKSASRTAANLSSLGSGCDSNCLDSVDILGLDSIDTINDFPDLVNEENSKSECMIICEERDSERGPNSNGNDSGGSLSLDLNVSGNNSSVTQFNEREVFDAEIDGSYMCNQIESRSIVRRLGCVDDELLSGCSLDMIKSSTECSDLIKDGDVEDNRGKSSGKKVLHLEGNGTYLVNSIESRLVAGGKIGCDEKGFTVGEDSLEGFEGGVKFDVLLKLCTDGDYEDAGVVYCPLCGVDISDLSEESQQVHTNECLDQEEDQFEEVSLQIIFLLSGLLVLGFSSMD